MTAVRQSTVAVVMVLAPMLAAMALLLVFTVGELNGVRPFSYQAPSNLAEAAGKGSLPASQSGVSVSRPGVLVTAFGKNPDGRGVVLRVWDQTGDSGDLTVMVLGNFTTATPINLRGEDPGTPLPVRDGKLTFPLKAYAPASFLMR